MDKVEIRKHEPIIITLSNGMKIKGVAVITGYEEHNAIPTGIEYTIPNMHFNLEGNKLVKSFKGGVGTTYHGTIGQCSLVVDDPLMTIVED